MTGCIVCVAKASAKRSADPKLAAEKLLVGMLLMGHELEHPFDGLCDTHRAILLDGCRFIHEGRGVPSAGDA